jgi:hypothetical protein
MFIMQAKSTARVNLSISLPAWLREEARRAAFADNRSVSSFVALVLQRELRDSGGSRGEATHPSVQAFQTERERR